MVESERLAQPKGEPPIAPTHVRYIKLGTGGSWARGSITDGYVAFGYHSIPDEICRIGDWDQVRNLLADRKSEGAVTAGVNEVAAFYQMPDTCLWITFADGHLWWAFAETEVVWVGADDDGGPSRFRPTISPWRNTDLRGRALRMSGLSSRLTKVANFRATICTVAEEAYLLRRINGIEEPIVVRANAARQDMIDIAVEMIQGLHWADFETLTDLIFARSGWQRNVTVGRTMADVDLIMEQPTTGEIAFVQVKSQADQATVDDYIARFRSSGCDRFFFICHSPRGQLRLPDERALHLFAGERLADAAVKNGLFDWLVERSG